MTGRASALLVLVTLVPFVATTTAPLRVARADESPHVAAARDAYDRGVAAFEAKDFAAAARAFAEADATVPNAVALATALDAATRADDAVFAMELVARADVRKETNPQVLAAVQEARTRFARRVGRIRVACVGCSASVDEVPIVIGELRVVRVGEHRVRLRTEQTTELRVVDVQPEATSLVELAPAPAPARVRDDGVSPAYFFLGLGATVALAGATTVTALAARADHRSFDAQGCAHASTPSCVDLADRGSSEQTRTNVLLGVTAAAAITTAAIGLFVVRWSRAESSVAPTSGGAVASLRVKF